MLLVHRRIYLSSSGEATDALLIRNGIVIATGAEARAKASRGEETLSPSGACLFPALWDAHIHLWGAGLRAGSADLRNLDLSNALKTLKNTAPDSTGWIVGLHLDDNQFRDGEVLDRIFLDDHFPDQPICVRRVDGHALWANSIALMRAEIKEDYSAPPGGSAPRNPAGRLTGRFVDTAMEDLIAALPEPTWADNKEVFLHSANLLRSQGITAATMAFCPVEEVDDLIEMDKRDELPLFVDVLVDGTDPNLEALLARGPYQGQNLRIGGIKFFADGALGSSGAHMLDEYRDGGKGLAIHPPGYLIERVGYLAHQGWQVAVHAIGDGAAREVLDAYEALPEEVRTPLRMRLEHAQLVAKEDAQRIEKMSIIASIQPIHLHSDATWAEKRLQDHQMDRLFPWGHYKKTTFAAGSDYPIEDPNPWHGIATAMTRKDRKGRPFRVEEHGLSLKEALFAYTSGAAYAAHQEHQMGTLLPGHRAQWIALDRDPFESRAEEIWDTKVLQVWDYYKLP